MARIATWKLALGIALAAGTAGPAQAAPIDPSSFSVTTGFGSTNWRLYNLGGTDTGNPYTGSCSSVPALSISDANSASGAGDAYDEAWLIYIGGSPFVAPNPSDLSGTTFTAGPVTLSGLTVTVQYHFFTDRQLARISVALSNPTGQTVTVPVQVPVNFGSDGSTLIQHTSSGDTTVTTADRWVVSSDSGPSDPVNTTVMYGPGNVVSAPTAYTQTIFNCAGPQGLGADFSVSVPANGTRGLMFFAGLGDIVGQANTIAGAISSAALFNDGPAMAQAGLLNNLGIFAANEVVNWDFGAVVIPQCEGVAGEVYFSRSTYNVTEGGRPALELRRSGGNTSAQTVQIGTGPGPSPTATAGLDYAGFDNRTFTLPAGQTRIPLTLDPILDDRVYEPTPESFTLMLFEPSPELCLGNTALATIRILDNDPPTLSLSVGNSSLVEGGATQVTATLAATRSTQTRVALSYQGSARFAADYQLSFNGRSSSTIVIPAGQTSGSIQLDAKIDNSAEGTEGLVLSARPSTAYSFADPASPPRVSVSISDTGSQF